MARLFNVHLICMFFKCQFLNEKSGVEFILFFFLEILAHLQY